MTGEAQRPSASFDLTDNETSDLKRFVALVERWNPRINLISKASVPEIWDRHILDSVQVFDLAPATATSWADLGSGGGFPGIVVAILAAHRRPALQVTLVESDQRKAVFLRQAIRELGLRAVVRAQRIEQISDLSADVVSARALAALPELLAFSAPLLSSDGVCLFAKGAGRRVEIEAARQAWNFDVVEAPSLTDQAAAILRITGVHHV